MSGFHYKAQAKRDMERIADNLKSIRLELTKIRELLEAQGTTVNEFNHITITSDMDSHDLTERVAGMVNRALDERSRNESARASETDQAEDQA